MIRELVYKGVVYSVSDTGVVYKNSKRLPIRINADGYCVVSTKDYNCYWRSTGVHRLVALVYCEGHNEDRNEVNHKDYNRMNNNASNLEWVTHKENIAYSKCNKARLFGKSNPNYGNHKLHNYYKLNPDISKAKQSRPGIKNGRARSISIYKDGNKCIEFELIKDCCQYLIDNNITVSKNINSIRSRIDASIRNNKSYKGYTFVKNS